MWILGSFSPAPYHIPDPPGISIGTGPLPARQGKFVTMRAIPEANSTGYTNGASVHAEAV
ncbi:MAG: hypothetical protein BMS9Abin09_1033 [Gammaproteobacteria bacterium]|nr:MAG: hypothetical protein BMS9Abin09_1033 [Gammaproteobacteria bacterium]